MGKHKYAVVGLGAFGSTVARELESLGNEVLGIDEDEARVNPVADEISHAVIGDGRDERTLRNLGLAEYDGVVVAIGEDLESSILCTLALKNLGVQQVWVKATSPAHHLILEKLGADRIVNPEHHVGVHVARTMIYPHVLDYIALGDDDYVVEFEVPEQLDRHSVSELQLQERYGIEVLAFKRAGSVSTRAGADLLLSRDDRLVLLGRIAALRRFSREKL
ncbi:Ktr system potassium uptake protein A [Paraburkholderia ultramafica]|uniref:Ktr system potassium uptake protein A n=1 Tax=Paraburkholderia ultramafica TaxID=1544867 RepID=A0A6S7AWU6_9BURK|nr:TrkA family potassium uptake protein [Paraburkholderia ultramafica]CAB3780291.1 Ktr system potassium uptake protein A [Paraburkholderia ultramafica]